MRSCPGTRPMSRNPSLWFRMFLTSHRAERDLRRAAASRFRTRVSAYSFRLLSKIAPTRQRMMRLLVLVSQQRLSYKYLCNFRRTAEPLILESTNLLKINLYRHPGESRDPTHRTRITEDS